ncbi:polysaccharide deacetylase [Sulfurimonas gotlandica GD1]|uniref:Polysaccharide deacetylase n=1 Tax=Sulfurimonas gotlandica (strain DSM 19862 / JCM 16533 / GD1) TaxID=929558 RepID=H1FUT1_SULGG|nr:polysaccharide deacetylase family protein [Sulfurimonas gotlandica]EHP28938.1 polysaccharide deacetylase [Sulfurimonas gotlandica GD1]
MNSAKIIYLLLFFLISPIFANSAVVFMYHRFGESKYPSTNITIEQFGYQLDYLEKNHYNVWHLSKIVEHIKNKKSLPPKTVALTIDDAYISTFTKAYPMLKSKHFPFTVVVSTNQVESKSESYMSWDQLRTMKADGAEFANHSKSHDFVLAQNNETDEVWKKRITYEIQKAQDKIHEELGAEVNENPRLFSYPFGEYDLKTAQLIKELGYIGITQTSGPLGENCDLRTVTRFPMAEAFASPNSFISKLNTLPMPIESISQKEPVFQGKNPPKLRIILKKPLENINCFLSNGDAIDFKWVSQTEIEVSANEPIKPPREKYTCTAPAQDGKWYWYSHLWIVK